MTTPLPPAVQQALVRAGETLRAGDSAAADRALDRVLASAPFSRWFQLGGELHAKGELAQAEALFRRLARMEPAQAAVALMLGAVLIDAGRPGEAADMLRAALPHSGGGKLEAALRLNLGLALRRQRKDADALAQYDGALALDPGLPGIALHRAEALQNLGRYDEALAVLEDGLARAPGDAKLHHHYNDLLYRLGRDDRHLKSYEMAPRSRDLLLGKAFFLDHQNRAAEALEIYRALLAQDANDVAAQAGAGGALSALGRRADAMAAFDAALAKRPAAELYSRAAENALRMGDPQKAATLCEHGLADAPHHQKSLAILSSAWRLAGDVRDEALNGYDTLVRVFDLEPPDGF